MFIIISLTYLVEQLINGYLNTINIFKKLIKNELETHQYFSSKGMLHIIQAVSELVFAYLQRLFIYLIIYLNYHYN